MDPTKRLLNSLQCPICKAPIDVLGYGIRTEYNYGCAANMDHYAIKLINWEPIVRLDKEAVNIYDAKHKYSIIRTYQDGKVSTSIEVYETDLENRVIFSFKQKKLVMEQDLFDFSNFKPDKALNRIKTIFLFQ